MPLSMKKQFLHILRTNEVEFKPSIRNGFVETKIRMVDHASRHEQPRSKSRKAVIGQEQYKSLLGNKYSAQGQKLNPGENKENVADQNGHQSGKKYHKHCLNENWNKRDQKARSRH